MEILDKLSIGKNNANRRNPEVRKAVTRREKTIPPRIVACKVCEGRGVTDGSTCPQCDGSGRVIVSFDVVTYVTAYRPEREGGDR